MDRTFRLSLLYLLLIIPQHGNSPIPRMESWMEMDQGDGFVDRDLTSSLTGAESFGSAHKNYQNALIRKKEADPGDELGDERIMDEFSGRIPDRMQRRAPITPNFMQNRYSGFGYNNYLPGNEQNQPYQQQMPGMNTYQDQRYREQLLNNEPGSNTRFDSRFPIPSMADSPLMKNARPFRISEGNGQEENNEVALSPRFAKCSFGGSGKFDPESDITGMVNREEGFDESKYIPGSEELQSRMKSELNDEDLGGFQIEGGDEQNENLLRYNRGDEDDAVMDESDYYSEMKNPSLVRSESDVDYNQINEHGDIYKREEMKTRGANLAPGTVSQGSQSDEDKDKSLKESRSSNNNLLKAEAPKESHDITNDVIKGKLQNSNMVWPTNSNVQSKQLDNVMRDSQKFDEGQLSEDKSPQFHRESIDWKEGHGKRNAEERRNKREDEDEQKNMKTGTDEGGGEYEDEEGKGHNDEEEYYEEAEMSGSRGIRAQTGFSDHFNHKLYKRETGKDEEEKGSKGGEADVSSEDYELNLENAPVEHGDIKKSSWREGTTRKKSIARRGMKIWDEWGKWSSCSVTCGVGRKTRWRHCIGGGCARGEKEALIKKCTNPAC